MKHRIVADDKIPFLKGILEFYVAIEYLPADEISKDKVKHADAILIRTSTRCDRNLLENSQVTFIGTATVGFDHIDTKFCSDNSIHWINAAGCNEGSVCQYICAALFAIAERDRFPLKDKTLGIVGVGHIGKLVQDLAVHLGMKVLLNDPPRERNEGPAQFVSYDHLLKVADIVTFHVPLNQEGEDKTMHMVDESALRKMKKDAWLINSARGEVIDDTALRVAISKGFAPQLILDVWSKEPDADPELLSAAYLATPHIAGYSVEGKANGTAMIVKELARFFDLPLKDWFPGNLPEPENPEMTLDASGKSSEQILSEAVRFSYDIKRDDRNFRQNLRLFEQLRGNYPVRREFPSYKIHLRNGKHETIKILKKLGFSVISVR